MFFNGMATMTAMEKDAMAGQFYRLIVRGRRKEAMEFALMHKNKFSALEKACRHAEADIALALIEEGWDVNEGGNAGYDRTPLISSLRNETAAKMGPVVLKLLERGADPMKEEFRGYSGLTVVCQDANMGRREQALWRQNLIIPVFNSMRPEDFRRDIGNAQILEVLGRNVDIPFRFFREAMNRGANVNAVNRVNGSSFLMDMVRHGRRTSEGLLIRVGLEAVGRGLNLNQRDIAGNSLLTLAARLRLMRVIKWLSEYPEVQVNWRNELGQDAMWLAASFGDGKAVDILFAMGSSIETEARTFRGQPIRTTRQAIGSDCRWRKRCNKEERVAMAIKFDNFNIGKPIRVDGQIKSLQHLCGEVIRRRLAMDGRNIKPKIDKLRLPTAVKLRLASFELAG